MIEEDIDGTSSVVESSETAVTLVGNEQMIEEYISGTSFVAESRETAITLVGNESINIIDHKFLVPGHTMMECDSMHYAIEYAYKNLRMYSINEWVNILKNDRCKNPYNVNCMEFRNFHNLKDLASKLVVKTKKMSNDETIIQNN